MLEEHLEMVLKWRNSNHIRQYAVSREIITLQTHTKWFNTLKEKGDLYFIIEVNKKPIGLIWANNFQKDSCETGMYIYNTQMQNSLFAYRASLTLNKYLFQTKKLNSIVCEILNDNSRSIRFTLSLGYKITEKKEILSTYLLTQTAFMPYYDKISRLLNKNKLD